MLEVFEEMVDKWFLGFWGYVAGKHGFWLVNDGIEMDETLTGKKLIHKPTRGTYQMEYQNQLIWTNQFQPHFNQFLNEAWQKEKVTIIILIKFYYHP
jgi:hypothetical protein